MTYIIKNNLTGRSYKIESAFEIGLDIVWASEKCWFAIGDTITITDENGKSKVITK